MHGKGAQRSHLSLSHRELQSSLLSARYIKSYALAQPGGSYQMAGSKPAGDQRNCLFKNT